MIDREALNNAYIKAYAAYGIAHIERDLAVIAGDGVAAAVLNSVAMAYRQDAQKLQSLLGR